LTSRACLSHRMSPSTFSSAASTQEAPPNKWLISHGDRLSEVYLCALFSLMRSASSLLTAPGIPRFVGPSPKEEGDSKKRPHTHDANGYQATLSDRCFCKYLVYQVLSGVSVSWDTLCLMTHPHPWNILKDERGCNLRVWDAGPEEEGGGLALTGSVTEKPYAT
jgi:hypothetical protein